MNTSATMRGADVVVRTLAAHGVRTIFALSGNQIMPLFDALLDADIALIHVRHEAAAVHMAESWAQVTGEVGVALLTAGPGFANGLSALYTARASETPVLLLSGDAPMAEAGLGAFQQMAQSAAAAPFVKSTARVERPELLGAAIADAMMNALADRSGPVHLSLPFDVLNARLELGVEPGQPAARNDCGVTADAAAEVVARLGCSKRPLVLVGPQLCRHWWRDRLADLGQALSAPVIPMQSPRGLNDASLGAFAEVAGRTDTVVLLGKALDFALGFARPPGVAESASFIQVDPDADIIERSRRALGDRLAAAYCGNAAASIANLQSAAAKAAPPRRRDWLDEVAAAVSCRPVQRSGPPSGEGEALHPLDICHAVQAVLDRSANPVLVCDGGEFGQWAQACLTAPRRIINGPAGGIGAAIPYAIAARLADPTATVVAMTGDGAVGFHLAEIDTAVRYNAPFIAVVGNDARWNAEYQIQLREYGAHRLHGCELLATAYGSVAEAFGGFGEAVRNASELGPALERAHASGMPACVDVRLAGQPAPKPRRQLREQGCGPP